MGLDVLSYVFEKVANANQRVARDERAEIICCSQHCCEDRMARRIFQLAKREEKKEQKEWGGRKYI